ncbi:MAG: EMC3/TMCO1 family protein [Candidatus Thermoplasmatota archaeon]|jgi:uncharacterized membrane protein (DUF106 family)|nr:EMC3/TMCO1 family protein [Candidatus Thermoplasmatota archaeon]
MTSAGETPRGTPDMCKGPSGFILIFLGFITVFIMFNMELRMQLAGWIGYVLTPLIGFDYNYPVITFLLAGMILVAISSTIRHFQTDWIEMAKNQKQIKTINKALKEAKMSGDTEKERKITVYQQQMMSMQQNMMFTNMKMMVYTMLIAIAIFTWIWADFIEGLDVATLSVPWNLDMGMLKKVTLCCYFPFPKWILVYMLISFPLGMGIQHALKRYTFLKKLNEARKEERKKIKEMVDDLESTLEDFEDEVYFPLDTIKDKLAKANAMYAADDFSGAMEYGRLSLEELEETKKAFYKTQRRVDDIGKAVAKARIDGMNPVELESKIELARKSLKKGSFKDALTRVQDVSNSLKNEKKYYRKTLDEAKEIRSLLYGIRKISPDHLDKHYEEMETDIKKSDYKGALKRSREMRKQIKSLKKEDKSYWKIEKKFDRLFKEVKSLMIDVKDEVVEYNDFKALYNSRDISSAREKAENVYKTLKKKVSQKTEVKEAFSHAKLILSNAKEYGADVTEAELKYKDAEKALVVGEDDRAIELLAKATQEAERLKKQVSRKQKRR